MSELTKQFEAIRGHMRPVHWSPSRAEDVLNRIHKGRRRFTFATIAVSSAALTVAIVVAIVWFAQGGNATSAQIARQDSHGAQQELQLHDGTRAVALDGESELRLVQESDELVSFALDSGKGWFQVPPSKTRKVEVRVADLRVEVLGTEFVVEVQAEVVHVWVHRGRVRIVSSDGVVTLRAGEDEEFPAHPDTTGGLNENVADAPPAEQEEDQEEEQVDKEEEARLPASRSQTHLPAPVVEEPSSDASPMADDTRRVADLWKRADAARLAGNHRGATSALIRLLDEHSDDPRAPLAAFTLGRVLMDTGHSASTAARAFAKARKLAPQGPLVEDALLREIEAWLEDGDSRRVRRRCDKYLRLFPDGQYRRKIYKLRRER